MIITTLTGSGRVPKAKKDHTADSCSLFVWSSFINIMRMKTVVGKSQPGFVLADNS